MNAVKVAVDVNPKEGRRMVRRAPGETFNLPENTG
jgi:hypothetical protein